MAMQFRSQIAWTLLDRILTSPQVIATVQAHRKSKPPQLTLRIRLTCLEFEKALITVLEMISTIPVLFMEVFKSEFVLKHTGEANR